MVMSRDPGLRFRKFLFFAQFCIKFWEKLPNLGEIGQRTRKLQTINKLGGWKTPAVLIGLTPEICRRAKNHGKKFPELRKTSFSRIVNGRLC